MIIPNINWINQKRTIVEVLPKYHSLFKCRVLKRNYSILLIKGFPNNRRNNVYARARILPISLLDFQEKDPCYLSSALYFNCESKVFISSLAYPPGNLILETADNSHSSLTKTKIISQETLDFCITRLNNIQFYKYNNKYINLTKDFLTDPSFLFLAYNQIKSKAGNTTRAVDSETLDAINKKWFINAVYKIKNNKYIFKPSRQVNIPKPNSAEFRSHTIGSPRRQNYSASYLCTSPSHLRSYWKNFSWLFSWLQG